MTDNSKINVRGVLFNNLTFDETISLMDSYVKENKQAAVFTPNSEIVHMCIKDDTIKDIISKSDITLPDGIGVVKAAKILKTPLKERVSGFDCGEKLIALSSENDYRIFFLGSKPGIAEEAKNKMEEKYPGCRIVGTHNGYFDKEGKENDEVISLINSSNANILFVCLGAPAQEKWINANRNKLPNINLLLGIGGSLDGYSGNVKRAPQFYINHNLEWFYRLICQPSRIGRMMRLPKFYFGTILYKMGIFKH